MAANLPHMSLPQMSLSTNLVVIGIIGLVIIYGVLAGHSKVRNLAMSTYVGIVLAAQLGPGLASFLSKNGHGIGPDWAKVILFVAPIVLLEVSRRHHGKGAHAGMIVTAILSILTAGLIIGMGLGQMSGDTLKHITDGSIIAFELYTYRLWLVTIVPVFIIAEAFVGPGRSEKH